LKPLDDKYNIKRIVYSTYQAVSGAGKSGIEDLENGISGIAPKKFPYPIVNNCLPHIDVFMPDGYTKEEYKMINETRKILNKPNLPITATCVRVPVKNCHSESINVEFENEIDIYDIKTKSGLAFCNSRPTSIPFIPSISISRKAISNTVLLAKISSPELKS